MEGEVPLKVGDQIEVFANTQFPDTENPDELIGWKGVVTHVYGDGDVAVDFEDHKGLLFAPDELKVVGILCEM